jgi:hypothetical protein
MSPEISEMSIEDMGCSGARTIRWMVLDMNRKRATPNCSMITSLPLRDRTLHDSMSGTNSAMRS